MGADAAANRGLSRLLGASLFAWIVAVPRVVVAAGGRSLEAPIRWRSRAGVSANTCRRPVGGLGAARLGAAGEDAIGRCVELPGAPDEIGWAPEVLAERRRRVTGVGCVLRAGA